MIRDIPELQALDDRASLVRIPPELDVPVTPRVRQLMDTAEFRRLAKISQLGLVSHVYPAAHHSRFEHCLGVYRMALLYLKRLSYDQRFSDAVSAHGFESDQFVAMLRTFRDYRHARSTYLEHFFSLAEMRQQAAQQYCPDAQFAIPDLALANAEALLEIYRGLTT